METGRLAYDFGFREKCALGLAVILSLGGTLVGFAGLIMWSFRAAELMLPDARTPPEWVATIFPYATLLNFALMATITIMGVLNILLATRAREFLAGGWKRWMFQSMVSVVAAVIFLNATNVS